MIPTQPFTPPWCRQQDCRHTTTAPITAAGNCGGDFGRVNSQWIRSKSIESKSNQMNGKTPQHTAISCIFAIGNSEGVTDEVSHHLAISCSRSHQNTQTSTLTRRLAVRNYECLAMLWSIVQSMYVDEKWVAQEYLRCSKMNKWKKTNNDVALKCFCYTQNACCPQNVFGDLKSPNASRDKQNAFGDNHQHEMHIGTITHTHKMQIAPEIHFVASKCISWCPKWIFIQPQLVWMHLDVKKCISLCNKMRTDENCNYQPQYSIRFHTAVVNAINWLKFANHNNTCLYHQCVTYLLRLQPVHQIL
jgi:hypothetical protein